MKRARTISVIGAGAASRALSELAEEVGQEIARRGAVLVCGGRGGVMLAAAGGALRAGGHTIGILPGSDRTAANPNIEFAIATGIGEARNAIVVASGDAVIALQGEAGTLSEIGLAMKMGRPVVALNSWANIGGIERASNAKEAVALALRLGARYGSRKVIDDGRNH
jgi:uncharacterized protein (TIGR00725 family)